MNNEPIEPADALAPELELVAQLLAEGKSDAAAGGEVGRSAKFVQRHRTGNPEFVRRVRELKEQRAAQAAAGLGALLEEAVEAVRRGLQAEKATDQLRAAALVFDRYQAFRSESEAAERLRDLKGELTELRRVVAALERPGLPALTEGVG